MKYVWIAIVVVLLVRIDVLMKLFDKAVGKIQTSSEPVTRPSDVPAGEELIPIAQDKALQQTPKAAFLNLLSSFQQNPQQDVRDLALTELRNYPTMFTAVLDKDLESQIYHLRDLVIQGNEQTAVFLVELMKYVTGENYDMVRRFFSLWIDADMEKFLRFYSRSKDSNCQAISFFADPVPEEEKLNELLERENDLNEFLTKTSADPALKKFADTCLLMLKVQISKLAPAQLPSAAPVSPEGNQP